jgi:hypothetical protein
MRPEDKELHIKNQGQKTHDFVLVDNLPDAQIAWQACEEIRMLENASMLFYKGPHLCIFDKGHFIAFFYLVTQGIGQPEWFFLFVDFLAVHQINSP